MASVSSHTFNPDTKNYRTRSTTRWTERRDWWTLTSSAPATRRPSSAASRSVRLLLAILVRTVWQVSGYRTFIDVTIPTQTRSQRSPRARRFSGGARPTRRSRSRTRCWWPSTTAWYVLYVISTLLCCRCRDHLKSKPTLTTAPRQGLARLRGRAPARGARAGAHQEGGPPPEPGAGAAALPGGQIPLLRDAGPGAGVHAGTYEKGPL